MNKCIFLDRDGVVNEDIGDYVWKSEDFVLTEQLKETLEYFKKQNYLIIIITNQGGIQKGLYSHNAVETCHDIIQKGTNNSIDDYYYSPYHPNFSESISRKPGTLSFERAAAKYNIDFKNSWMIGDMERDLIPAKNLGMKTILINTRIPFSPYANFITDRLYKCKSIIV